MSTGNAFKLFLIIVWNYVGKNKHGYRVPKTLGVEPILAESGEIQRVKEIISGKRETCKDRED